MYEPRNQLLIPVHNFLVRACETERGLPSVLGYGKVKQDTTSDLHKTITACDPNIKSLWPDTEAERHIDYTPDRTKVTYCKPTGKQIDDHERALQIVAAAIDGVTDRTIIWAVAQSAAFRERGPKWRLLALKFKDMGMGYPKSEKVLKHRYEESLLSILSLQVSKNWHKIDADLFCEGRRFDI